MKFSHSLTCSSLTHQARKNYSTQYILCKLKCGVYIHIFLSQSNWRHKTKDFRPDFKTRALHNNTWDLPETCCIKPLTCLYLQNDDLLTPLQSIHVSSCAEVKPCQLCWTLIVYFSKKKSFSPQVQTPTPETAWFECMCVYETHLISLSFTGYS